MGPGDEVAPNPIAATKSTVPATFQIRSSHFARVPCRAASHATGTAVAPTRISPQPATGANGAGSRCAVYSTRNVNPITRRLFAPIKTQSGNSDSATRAAGIFTNATPNAT